ncbi:hypothetical protein E3T40_15440 [Cryobacterium sp. TMT1-19]|uniref:hypothetical protein n=1 Tax=unclassified Cryobacterium TaxID=2649013 RepID=UPI000CE49E76|nr:MULTISPECIES: hypothetical protein [unclassified Cryobacterium]TFD30384.1 hypothetical protein E3T40_15440 [Cryobacterium sp. TMT1-19]
MSRETNPAARRQLPIPTATPVNNTATPAAQAQAGTVAALGHDVAQRVLQLRDDDLREREHLARILIHTVLELSSEHLAELVREPAHIGTPRWDAFLQALVAWRCQGARPRIQTPPWAKETRIDEAWAPFGGSIRDDGWYTLSVLSTPAAFLHRGIVLDRKNLEEL